MFFETGKKYIKLFYEITDKNFFIKEQHFCRINPKELTYITGYEVARYHENLTQKLNQLKVNSWNCYIFIKHCFFHDFLKASLAFVP